MRLHLVVAALVVSSVCMHIARAQVPERVKAAEATVDAEKIRAHVKFLADDLLEGRAPGLRGGDLAAEYIATQFQLYGLKPGGDKGGYLQQIKFFGMTVKRDTSTMSLVPASGSPIAIKFGPDYVVNNPRHEAVAEIDAPIVFVGYGVTAPEFGWDDTRASMLEARSCW